MLKKEFSLKAILTVLISSLMLAAACSSPQKKETVVEEKPVEVKPVGINCLLPNGDAKLEFQGASGSAATVLKVTKLGLEQYEQISYAPGAEWPLGKYDATMGNKTVTLELSSSAGAGKYQGTFTEGEAVGVTCDTYER